MRQCPWHNAEIAVVRPLGHEHNTHRMASMYNVASRKFKMNSNSIEFNEFGFGEKEEGFLPNRLLVGLNYIV